ncbi:MAG: hypothetical protein MRY49_03280 [Candidatus Pacebacteria bacterium]|nr:hypothetical protein [Candidatus Paceibacterota bacterium]
MRISYMLTFLYVFLANTAFAVSEDELFKESTEKGDVILEFLTTGWFAFAVTAAVLLYVIFQMVQGKMEFMKAFIIVFTTFLLSNVLTIAKWIVGYGS